MPTPPELDRRLMALADTPLYGAIEAGGTKFVCAIGSSPDHLVKEARFPTTTPAETLARCVEFFRAGPEVRALGVGCFGPLGLDPEAPDHGYVTTTPKVGWANTDVLGPLRQALGVPVGFDTDVNAALLGESRWGAARGLDSAVYVTVGTGIGGGALVGGNLVHGLIHPEMGHLLLPQEADDSGFAGACPYHGARCWEGLASGPALAQRWGGRGEVLPVDHPAWDLEARYLASALTTLVLVLSPRRIVLGGGVMQAPQLFPLVRAHLLRSSAGYVQADVILHGVESYVVPPHLGARAGVAGALVLAERALHEERAARGEPGQLS